MNIVFHFYIPFHLASQPLHKPYSSKSYTSIGGNDFSSGMTVSSLEIIQRKRKNFQSSADPEVMPLGESSPGLLYPCPETTAWTEIQKY